MAGCVVCQRTSPIKKCSRCHTTQYCSSECQKADWRNHRTDCTRLVVANGRCWYDIYRKCKDGNKHEGRLELITWPSTSEGIEEPMGWGNVIIEESDDMKRKFETEFEKDEAKLYDYWPQAFRWTCCGTVGDQKFGCDHHGEGTNPCSCDFCKMGEPMTENLYQERLNSAAGKGLDLPRGPDPRSFNQAEAMTAKMMRGFLGSDD